MATGDIVPDPGTGLSTPRPDPTAATNEAIIETDAATMIWLRQDDEPWPVIRFQPILFLFLWIAIWHVSIPGGGNASIDHLGVSAWPVWLVTGFACPPLLLLSWWLIVKQQGKWRYRGMWARFAADIGELGVVAAFLWARLSSTDPLTDARLFGWIAISSIGFFLTLSVVRDVIMLGTVEHIAAKARKNV